MLYFRCLITLTMSAFTLMADASEFHIQICETSLDEAIERLDFNDDDNVNKLISYFDTYDLHYLNQGAVIRFREDKSKVDLTVKIRRQFSKNAIIERWRKSDEIKCENDYYANELVRSCMIKNKIDIEDSYPELPTIERVRRLLSRSQIDFLNDHTEGRLQLQHLFEFGPVPTKIFEKNGVSLTDNEEIAEKTKLKLEFRHKPPLRIIELSFKDNSSEFEINRRKLLRKIRQSGLLHCADQESKTRKTIYQLRNR